jgi:hypothetical protein
MLLVSVPAITVSQDIFLLKHMAVYSVRLSCNASKHKAVSSE